MNSWVEFSWIFMGLVSLPIFPFPVLHVYVTTKQQLKSRLDIYNYGIDGCESRTTSNELVPSCVIKLEMLNHTLLSDQSRLAGCCRHRKR